MGGMFSNPKSQEDGKKRRLTCFTFGMDEVIRSIAMMDLEEFFDLPMKVIWMELPPWSL